MYMPSKLLCVWHFSFCVLLQWKDQHCLLIFVIIISGDMNVMKIVMELTKFEFKNRLPQIYLVQRLKCQKNTWIKMPNVWQFRKNMSQLLFFFSLNWPIWFERCILFIYLDLWNWIGNYYLKGVSNMIIIN